MLFLTFFQRVEAMKPIKASLLKAGSKAEYEMERTVQDHIDHLSAFIGGDLGTAIAAIERTVEGASRAEIPQILSQRDVGSDLLGAAAEIKRISAQIDVTIHAVGILRSLPHILVDGEHVESVSLGAGNTGKPFDLETNLRIAEFKFIQWRGGPESIRQNGIFKDFFDLATAETSKKRCLYLLGTHHALKFFRGRRALSSILNKNQATRDKFIGLYGDQYATVNEFFADHDQLVEIIDVLPWLPELTRLPDQAVTIENTGDDIGLA